MGPPEGLSDGDTHHINPQQAEQVSNALSHVAVAEWPAFADDRLAASDAAVIRGPHTERILAPTVSCFISTSFVNLRCQLLPICQFSGRPGERSGSGCERYSAYEHVQAVDLTASRSGANTHSKLNALVRRSILV